MNPQAVCPDRRLCSSPTPSARGRTQPSLNRHGISKDDKDPGLRMFFLCVCANRHFRTSMQTTVPPLQFGPESSAKMRPRAHHGPAPVGLRGIRPIPLTPQKGWHWQGQPQVAGSGMAIDPFSASGEPTAHPGHVPCRAVIYSDGMG